MAQPLIKKVHTALKLIGNPYMFMARMGSNGLLNWLPDKPFLKIAYRGHTGRKLNLENPQRYTEKLQWLKLHDRNPLHTKLVDKYEIRNHLADKVDESHFVKLYGVYDKYDDIDWDVLPQSFIMKCTQGCGCNYIVNDKSCIDRQRLQKITKKWLKKNYYFVAREWPYKGVRPRLIIEELLTTNPGNLVDYKFFCFNGTVAFCRVMHSSRNGNVRSYRNMCYEDLNIEDSSCPSSSMALVKPLYFDEMVKLAELLSQGFKHIRVDFLGTKDNFYMGELTFFEGAGYYRYNPDSFDFDVGKLIMI